jgi:hypothetical protein
MTTYWCFGLYAVPTPCLFQVNNCTTAALQSGLLILEALAAMIRGLLSAVLLRPIAGLVWREQRRHGGRQLRWCDDSRIKFHAFRTTVKLTWDLLLFVHNTETSIADLRMSEVPEDRSNHQHDNAIEMIVCGQHPAEDSATNLSAAGPQLASRCGFVLTTSPFQHKLIASK